MLSAAPNLVLIALPTGDFLALSPEQFTEARTLGMQLAGPARQAANDQPQEAPLLSAEQMEARTSVPASWFLEQARKNAIPHVRLGKYVRFELSAVREAGINGRKQA